jgi:hypothetical protein
MHEVTWTATGHALVSESDTSYHVTSIWPTYMQRCVCNIPGTSRIVHKFHPM